MSAAAIATSRAHRRPYLPARRTGCARARPRPSTTSRGCELSSLLSLAETDGRGKTRCWRQRALGCGLPRRPLAHVARIPALARLSARPRCRRPAAARRAAGQLTYKSYDAQSSRSLPARRAAPACVTALSLSAPRALACGSYTSLSRAHTIQAHTRRARCAPAPCPCRTSRPPRHRPAGSRPARFCSVLKSSDRSRHPPAWFGSGFSARGRRVHMKIIK